ncbi:MAG TPA: hypothetical protein DEF12_10495 [Rhodobacteraceae bacterium]|jgi:hypothetical protein|nr:hypothetical protein [Paracoccaceae bacterium]
MSFREPHELHKRRGGLNIGVGVVLVLFVAVVFGLTIAKVSTNGFQMKPGATSGQTQSQTGGGN